jgi:tetratricopeptide (TPR) repeat protein
VLKSAQGAAARATALAPESGQAHLAVALTCQRLLDFRCAASEFDRALALAPGDARVQSNFGRFAGFLGHRDAAQAAARHAVSLDPQNYDSHLGLSQVLFDAELYDEAIAAARAAKALNPNLRGADIEIARDYLALGRSDVARQLCESRATVIADDDRLWCLAIGYHALGMQAAAQAQVPRLRALGWGEARAVSFAGLYAQWGDKRSALQWLAVAERTRASALQGLKVNWSLAPLRGEPEFEALEARLDFPP